MDCNLTLMLLVAPPARTFLIYEERSFVLIQIEQRTGRNINTGNMIQMNSSNYFCRKNQK